MYQTHYRLLILSITISIYLHYFICSASKAKQPYDICKQNFQCGDSGVIGELGFPFWGVNRPSYCGKPGFVIKCVNNTPTIRNSTYDLRVIGTDPQDNMITVSMADFSTTLCPSTVLSRKLENASFLELSLGSLYIDNNHTYSLLTILYGCPVELGQQLSWSSASSCYTNESVSVHFVTDTVNSSISSRCLYVAVLPILQQNAQHLDDNPSSLAEVLDQGFEMKWITQQDKQCQTCMRSGGVCGFDWIRNQLSCYCPDDDNATKLLCRKIKQDVSSHQLPSIVSSPQPPSSIAQPNHGWIYDFEASKSLCC